MKRQQATAGWRRAVPKFSLIPLVLGLMMLMGCTASEEVPNGAANDPIIPTTATQRASSETSGNTGTPGTVLLPLTATVWSGPISEWRAKIVDCLREQGYDAEVPADDFEADYQVNGMPPGKGASDALQNAVATCESRIGARNLALPSTDAAWRRVYDHNVLLVECLRRQGATVQDIPSFEVFSSPQNTWSPWEFLGRTQTILLSKKCPAEPWMIEEGVATWG